VILSKPNSVCSSQPSDTLDREVYPGTIENLPRGSSER
jgi:hypothetical protein